MVDQDLIDTLFEMVTITKETYKEFCKQIDSMRITPKRRQGKRNYIYSLTMQKKFKDPYDARIFNHAIYTMGRFDKNYTVHVNSTNTKEILKIVIKDLQRPKKWREKIIEYIEAYEREDFEKQEECYFALKEMSPLKDKNQKPEKETLAEVLDKMTINLYKEKNGYYSLRIQKSFKDYPTADRFRLKLPFTIRACQQVNGRAQITLSGQIARELLNETLPDLNRTQEWKLLMIDYLAAKDGAFPYPQEEIEEVYQKLKKIPRNGRIT